MFTIIDVISIFVYNSKQKRAQVNIDEKSSL